MTELESMFETVSGLRAKDFEAEWLAFRSMMTAHDHQLLDRIEANLWTKHICDKNCETRSTMWTAAHQSWITGNNGRLDEVKTILNKERQKL